MTLLTVTGSIRANQDLTVDQDTTLTGNATVNGTLNVSSGALTTSTAQKEAIVQAGPGSGTLDVSSGTFTTSAAQKKAIIDGADIQGTAILSSGESSTNKYLRIDGDGSCSWQQTGKILQVISSTYTGSTTTTSTSGTFPSALTVSITIASGSRVWIMGTIGGEGADTTYTTFGYMRRGSTYICLGGASSNRRRVSNFQRQESSQASNTMAMNFVDNPGAGTHTYSIGVGVQSGEQRVQLQLWRLDNECKT